MKTKTNTSTEKLTVSSNMVYQIKKKIINENFVLHNEEKLFLLQEIKNRLDMNNYFMCIHLDDILNCHTEKLLFILIPELKEIKKIDVYEIDFTDNVLCVKFIDGTNFISDDTVKCLVRKLMLDEIISNLKNY